MSNIHRRTARKADSQHSLRIPSSSEGKVLKKNNPEQRFPRYGHARTRCALEQPAEKKLSRSSQIQQTPSSSAELFTTYRRKSRSQSLNGKGSFPYLNFMTPKRWIHVEKSLTKKCDDLLRERDAENCCTSLSEIVRREREDQYRSPRSRTKRRNPSAASTPFKAGFAKYSRFSVASECFGA